MKLKRRGGARARRVRVRVLEGVAIDPEEAVITPSGARLCLRNASDVALRLGPSPRVGKEVAFVLRDVLKTDRIRFRLFLSFFCVNCVCVDSQ